MNRENYNPLQSVDPLSCQEFLCWRSLVSRDGDTWRNTRNILKMFLFWSLSSKHEQHLFETQQVTLDWVRAIIILIIVSQCCVWFLAWGLILYYLDVCRYKCYQEEIKTQWVVMMMMEDTRRQVIIDNQIKHLCIIDQSQWSIYNINQSQSSIHNIDKSQSSIYNID